MRNITSIYLIYNLLNSLKYSIWTFLNCSPLKIPAYICGWYLKFWYARNNRNLTKLTFPSIALACFCIFRFINGVGDVWKQKLGMRVDLTTCANEVR